MRSALGGRRSTRLFLDAVEELFAELPSRARGSKEKLSEQAVSALRSLVDELVSVKTDEAKEMARRIAREEALFAGTSSGANVVASLRVAEKLGPAAKVVTLMVDSGLKYLSTDVYRKQ